VTKNSIVRLTPEIVGAVFAECTAAGDPTAKGWDAFVQTGGIGIAASNAGQRAFERNEWTTAWPMIDHLLRYFVPLAERKACELLATVVNACRGLVGASWSEEGRDVVDEARWALADWTADHSSTGARCLDLVAELVHWAAWNQESGRTWEDGGTLADASRSDSAHIADELAVLLAKEVGASAAREFVASIEALGTEEP
jgi:hypothetical protein